MYFRNYGLRNTWLDNCLKGPVSEDLSIDNMLNRPNTAGIWTTAPLPYLFITVKVIELERVSLSDMQILKTVC